VSLGPRVLERPPASPQAPFFCRPAAGAEAKRSTKPVLSKDLTLDATEAGLTGRSIRLESKVAGTKNIGYWNDADAKALWKVQIKKKGAYRVKAVVAATSPSKLAVEAAGQTLTVAVPATGGWAEQQTVDVGAVTFQKPGEYEVTARPPDAGQWKAVNLWKLVLTPVP